MLKTEDLKKVTELEGLDDTILTKIAALSAADEEQVLKARIGQIYGDIDRDFEKITGLKKPDGVKTYEFWPKQLKETIQNAEGLKDFEKMKTDYEASKGKIEELETKLKAAGGDSNALAALQAQLDAEQKAHQKLVKAKETLQKEFETYKRDQAEISMIQPAIENLKAQFVDTIPKDLRGTIMDAAKQRLMSLKREIVKAGKEETVQFFDEAGERINNPQTFQPKTAEEILRGYLGASIATEEGRAGGTGGAGGSGKDKTVVNLSGAKTQIEARNAIDSMLVKEGKPRGSQEYQTAMDTLWKENEVAKLPMGEY